MNWRMVLAMAVVMPIAALTGALIGRYALMPFAQWLAGWL